MTTVLFSAQQVSTQSLTPLLSLGRGEDHSELGWRGAGFGGHSVPPFSRFRPLSIQRFPLLYYFEISFFVMDPKIFLKAPLALTYTNFDGGVPAKKNAVILVIVFAYFGLFFKNFSCGAEILAKTGTFGSFERSRKINLVDLIKVDNNF